MVLRDHSMVLCEANASLCTHAHLPGDVEAAAAAEKAAEEAKAVAEKVPSSPPAPSLLMSPHPPALPPSHLPAGA